LERLGLAQNAVLVPLRGDIPEGPGIRAKQVRRDDPLLCGEDDVARLANLAGEAPIRLVRRAVGQDQIWMVRAQFSKQNIKRDGFRPLTVQFLDQVPINVTWP